MMRIAICDSDIKCAEKTKNMIYDYANKRRLELLVEIYDSSEALLESENNYLLIILDYHINGLNATRNLVAAYEDLHQLSPAAKAFIRIARDLLR